MELEDTTTQTAGQARMGTGLPGPTRASEFTSITREQEIEKTKQLYPDLGQVIPTAPPNIYQEPEEQSHIKRAPITAGGAPRPPQGVASMRTISDSTRLMKFRIS